jgi:hypothetical protein
VPDYTAPVVLHDQQPSIEDFCNKLHKQLVSQLKYAWVWGSSVRHQPQKVSGLLMLYLVLYSPNCVLTRVLSFAVSLRSAEKSISCATKTWCSW